MGNISLPIKSGATADEETSSDASAPRQGYSLISPG